MDEPSSRFLGRAPIDRETLAADISAMAFRTIDPGKSLNIDYELGGDEIVSIFERLCAKYDVDHDAFWAQIDFKRHFFNELDGCFPVAILVSWFVHLRRGRPQAPAQEPYTVDDLVRMMEAARRI